MNSQIPSQAGVEKMFDRICRRYDLFNRISSFGRDKSWRRRIAVKLKKEKGLRVLDAACGTGDVLLSLFENGCNISKAVGIDLSANMLEIAREKLKAYNPELKVCDAAALSFQNNEFDAVTCAFGVRNFSNLHTSLKEMQRILKPHGKLLILEFSIPLNIFFKAFFLFYLKFIIPIIGKIITGSIEPYKYLSGTVQTFSSGENFCNILQNSGFADTKIERLSFGAVMLYSAVKPT